MNQMNSRLAAWIAVVGLGMLPAVAQTSQPASAPASNPGSQPASGPVIQGVFRDPAMQPAIPTSRPGVRTVCYMGESVVTQPSGAPVGTMIVALRREYSQPDKTIKETMIIVHPKDATREETTIYQVDGNKVTAAPGGKWSVEGELTGPAWNWTGMKYVFKLNNNGGSVRGEEKLDDEALRDVRQFSGPDGTVRVFLRDDLHRITPEGFELFRKRLISEHAEATTRPASQPGASGG